MIFADAAVPGCHTCTQCVSRLAFAQADLASAARVRSRAVSPSRIRDTDIALAKAKANVARLRDDLQTHLTRDHDGLGDAA